MRDGLTEKLRAVPERTDLQTYLRAYRPKIVVVSGRDAGTEHLLDRESCIIGRGAGVDLPFNEPAMSRQHAAIDFVNDGFRIRDLGSMNGLRINGNRVVSGDIRHGDQIEVGGVMFQLVIDEVEDTPNTYDLTSEA